MCACVAYWAGIRRIVYAVSKGRVASDYYETPQDTRPLIDGFHQRIERVHMVELEDEVVSTLKEWEKIFLANQQA
jgi:tRNA(Arg) A34 adenosine deaminase TadA